MALESQTALWVVPTNRTLQTLHPFDRAGGDPVEDFFDSAPGSFWDPERMVGFFDEIDSGVGQGPKMLFDQLDPGQGVPGS